MVSFKERIEEMLATLIIWLMIMWDDIRETLITVIVTCIVASLLTNFFFQPVRVSGSSMHPTLKDGEVGFSSIVARRTGKIRRFDIVVIRLKERGEDLVKRVIGLPNETITYSDGRLYVDGVEIEETFLDQQYIEQYMKDNYNSEGFFTKDFSYTLGEDEYFCMGDNRRISQDSRYYGPFSSEDILSIGVFVLWPLSEFGSAD